MTDVTLQLNPLEDARLTKEQLSYAVWHYIFMMASCTYPAIQGITLPDPAPGYEAGKTPAMHLAEQWSKAVMRTFDGQAPILQWVNNWADSPGQLAEKQRPGCTIQVGRDPGNGKWVIQFWTAGGCYDFMRLDHKAPPPPGYPV